MREIHPVTTVLPILMSGAASYTEPDVGVAIGLLGDSITEGNSEERRNRGYWTWCDVLLGQLYDVVAYAGVGGNNCAQMLARVAADVIAFSPDVCVVMGGANDISGGRTYAAIIADLEDIYDLLHAAGIHIIATTSVPSTSYSTEEKEQIFRDLATWISSYVSAHSGYMTYCDTGSLYADANEQPLAGYTHDGVHPTTLGAYTIGSALATAIAGIAPARNLWLDAGDPRLLNFNTSLSGTGGVLASGATGSVAYGYQVAGGCVASKEARVGGGEWQKCAIAAGGARLSTESIDISAGFAEGDTLVMEVEFETDDDWVDVYQFHAYFEFRSTTTALAASNCLIVDNYSGPLLSPPVYLPRPPAGILRSEPMVVPAGCAAVRNYVYLIGAAGSFRVGRYQIRKI